MKNLFLFLFSLFYVMTYAQVDDENYFKTVPGETHVISGIPIYLYSVPVDQYENLGKAISFGETLKPSIDEKSTISSKVNDLIEMVEKRKKEGKVPEFDALIVNVNSDKILAIKYKGEKTLKAYAEKVKGIPVFFFLDPVKEYETVASLPADYSNRAKRGMLYDKVRSMMKRMNQKLENGEVKKFDAVIISPEDLSLKLIRFK